MNDKTTDKAVMPTTLPTYKGGVFDLDAPHAHVFDIEEIAHALSHVCRYGGHTLQHYSVAQHAVECSYIEADKSPYEKLMHDCAEAYIGDVTSPLKRMLLEYKRIEAQIEAALSHFFGLPMKDGLQCMPPEVRRVDLAMLATESLQLLKQSTRQRLEVWGWMEHAGIAPLPIKITPWSMGQAKHMFLMRFYQLCPDNHLRRPRWQHVAWHYLLARLLS